MAANEVSQTRKLDLDHVHTAARATVLEGQQPSHLLDDPSRVFSFASQR
jgi:hypothetical protein